jgi:hypothetical protein
MFVGSKGERIGSEGKLFCVVEAKEEVAYERRSVVDYLYGLDVLPPELHNLRLDRYDVRSHGCC